LKTQSGKRSTKDKIMQVAMDIITAEGFQGITTRKIAARAEVNVAAVNYHFGSKDALIREALRYLSVQLRDTFKVLQREEGEPEALLLEFISSYTQVICKYPDIIKNIVIHAIQDMPLEGHTEYILFVQNEGIGLIKQAIKRISPEIDDNLLTLKALNLISGLSMPFIMGKSIKELLGLDLYSDNIQKKYTALLLENIKKG
jgi:AcrR family transcriptional regulator